MKKRPRGAVSAGCVMLRALPRRQPRMHRSRLAYFFLAAAFLAGAAALFAGGFAAAALSALRLAAFGSTAALKAAPGTNFGTFCAAILILVPALGLKPER